MTLRLLAPAEAVHKSKQRTEGEKQKAVKIDALVAQKHKELAEAESNFAIALKRQHEIWAKEEKEHQEKVTHVTHEVTILEERRNQALIPLEERGKELETKDRNLRERSVVLDLRETDLNESAQSLADRLDEVSEREQKAFESAQSLLIQREDIESRRNDLKANTDTFTRAFTKASGELTERELVVRREEIALKNRAVTLKEREDKVADKEAGFDNRERAIQDKRETLNRAIAEIKQKYHVTEQSPTWDPI
jgi:chromosome segregation ATPase